MTPEPRGLPSALRAPAALLGEVIVADANAPAAIQSAAAHRVAYRPDIDGLRAVAVLPVVFYHAGFHFASGGFVGVDVFFVISGYVISKTLLADLEQGRFSIGAFYVRRVRRIFPALFAVMAACWVAAFVLFLPSYFDDFSRSLAATALFGSNFYFWKNSGYFANGADLRPLLHTWSLAVEEQFYIFAPLTLWGVFRYLRRRWLLALAPVALASLALSVYATDVGPTANFFLLPMRAWELLVGALLALSPPPALRRAWIGEVLALVGLALIAAPVFTYSQETPFPGLTAVPPCLGAALLIYVGAHVQSLVTRMLGLPMLVGVGLISYSLYLIHWPIISFFTYANLRPPTAGESAVIVTASLALAWASWRFIEQPFRTRRLIPPSNGLFVKAAAAMAVMASLGVAGAATDGFAGRFPADLRVLSDAPKGFAASVCFLDHNPDPTVWRPSACTIARGGEIPALLWGDSYAAHYAPGVSALAADIPFRVMEYAAAGCPPVLSYSSYDRPGCHAFNQHALAIIRQNHIGTVVLAARWVDLQRRGLDQLRSTLAAMRAMGVKTYVIGQSPMFTTDVHVIAYREGEDVQLDRWPISFDPAINRRLAELVGPLFVDPLAHLCEGRSCPYRDGGRLLFADEGHYSRLGSLMAVASYFPLLTRTGKGPRAVATGRNEREGAVRTAGSGSQP